MALLLKGCDQVLPQPPLLSRTRTNYIISKVTTFFDDAGNSLFDASQYEFFGKKAVEEVELGGLENDQDNQSLVPDEYQLFNKDEVQLSALVLLFLFICMNLMYVHLFVSSISFCLNMSLILKRMEGFLIVSLLFSRQIFNSKYHYT